MIDTLEQLSNAVGVITKHDARQVADAINRRVLDLVGASVIKLYWTEDAEDGTILSPFTYINETENDAPRPFQIAKTPNGVLAWVFHNRRTLWLEELEHKDLTSPVKNEAGGENVPPECIDVRPGYSMSSMICIPLTVRGDVRGLYSVELQSSRRFTPQVLRLFQRLGRSLSSLLWNADVYEYDQQKTADAVRQYLNSITGFAFDPIFLEERYKAGFIARPFDTSFGPVEESLAALFHARRVRARSYRPGGGREFIVEEIQTEIRNSHFCVADVTGANPNVMTEVGMMMVLGKHFLLIRKRGDATPRPFDVAHLPMYEYELGTEHGELRAWDQAADRFQPFDQVLESFIRHLPADTGFSTASDWVG